MSSCVTKLLQNADILASGLNVNIFPDSSSSVSLVELLGRVGYVLVVVEVK